MTGVTDVLGGQTVLLDDTDLALLQVNIQNGQLNTQTVNLYTGNSTVLPDTPVSFSQSVAAGPFTFNSGVLASEASGKMFNTSNDTLAILAPTGTYYRLTFYDNRSQWTTAVSLTSRFVPAGTVNTNVAMGNFQGNGYAGALAVYTSQANFAWGMRVIVANDPNNENALVNLGPEFVPSAGNLLQPNPSAVAIGDFNNDGRDEIALLMDDDQTLNFYAVDPTSLTITQTGTYLLPYRMAGNETMLAGRFRNCGTPNCLTNADLALVGTVFTSQSGASQISVVPVQITPQSNGTFTAQAMTQSGSSPFFQFPKAKDGVFNNPIAHAAPIVNSPQPVQEQLVIGLPLSGISSGSPWGEIEIGTFLPTGNNQSSLGQFAWESETPLLQDHGILFDVEPGNFDNQNADGTHNPGYQVATYTAEGHDRAPHVRIYNVTVPVPFPPPPNEAPGNWLQAESDYAPASGSVVSGFGNQILGLLMPTDFQSRSLRLGAPTVVTIPTQVQPDVVLGVPPMHVDWLTPRVVTNVPGCQNPDVPCIFNLTVIPSQPPAENAYGFASSFNFSSNSQTKTKQVSTTSWGISVKQQSGLSATWGDALASSTFSLKQAAQYTHDHSVAKTHDTFAGKITSDTATTVFSDYVFYSQKRMNIYYYPVLGQTACSSDGACGPQYVEYSVPDRVAQGAMEGDKLWWYQPVPQAGDVLSYPLDVSQLQQGFSDTIVPRTANPPTCVGISGANTTYSTTWSFGSGGGTTTGNANAFSDELTIGFSTKAKVPDVSKGSFYFNVSVGGNGSFSSLNENYASLSSSQGVLVTQPAFRTSITNCCGYGWGNMVFGLQNTVAPSAQTPEDLITDPDGNPVPSGNATTGPMFVGFLADVLSNKPGGLAGCGTSFSWWPQTYNQPDVSLNHPARWSWHQSTNTVTFNAPVSPSQVDVLDQPFYQMKGFFVSEQGAPEPAPTLSQATAGDQLNLTVRVYNDSLVSTTAPVHVRVYGQLYCSSTGTLCGNAFEIGETTIAAIAGFKEISNGAGSYQPNWTTATVPFDTTNYANDNLVFWVVTWMQNSAGQLVAEMPGKGLTAIPGAGIANISDVPFEAYSNNVGLYGDYHQFYIAPNSAPGASPASSPGTLKQAAIQSASQGTLNQSMPVIVSVTAGPNALSDGVNLAYYDGNPASGGSLLNFQRIENVDANGSYALHNAFLPATCGMHTLYAAAWADDQPQVEGSTPVNVTANATALVRSLLAATQSTQINDSTLQQNVLSFLSAASSAFQNGQTGTGDALLAAFVQAIYGASGQAVAKSDAGLLIAQASDLLGCSPLGFSLTAGSSSATVSPGQSVTFSLALTPTGYFKGPVQLTCGTAIEPGSCALSQQMVTLDGITQQQLVLTVTTGGGSASAAGLGGRPPRSAREVVAWALMLLFTCVGLALLQRERRRYAVWLCVLLFVSIGGAIGCGSHSGSSAANPGGYSVFVHASSGNVAQSTQVMVYVK